MENQDQEQTLDDTESKEVNTETSSEDNQDSQDEKQSKEGKSEQENLLETPDGRKVPPEELARLWKEHFYPEFTKKSQRLKELEDSAKQWETKAADDARQAVADNDLLKDVDPSVREAIIKIVEPVLESRFKQLDQKRSEEEADAVFERELSALEKEYSGGNNLPKFDREKVLNAMREPGNRIFDPREKFTQMHKKEFNDVLVREALKKQKGGVETESTGGGSNKPEGKTPKTFDDAVKAFTSRLRL